jgi:hypothetical protein
MIAIRLAKEIQRLLAEGLSQRGVQRATGAHRSTVSAIKHGTWRGWEQEDADEPADTGSQTRCPGCGGLVQQPCVACAALSHLEHTPPRPPAPESLGDDSSPRIQLRPPHEARYEPLHEAKLAADPRRNAPCKPN